MKPKIMIFASGSAEGGGSGFEKLVLASHDGILDAEIVAVVSNHEDGGVRARADRLGITLIHFPKPWTAERYQAIASQSGADFFALSGWLKLVVGLDPATRFNSRTVFNIHPGPLPKFGGPGMYGHHVHEAMVNAFREGRETHSAVCMHFVSSEYDRGPVFFRHNVEILKEDSAESLGSRVNQEEHRYQPFVTSLVVNGRIRWDGRDISSLRLPDGYAIEPDMCCTCPSECDCQSPPPDKPDERGGAYGVSNLCPVHNDNPRPAISCPVHGDDARAV